MYDSIKDFKEKKYTGMRVGGTHAWNYNEGKWWETKKSPDEWDIKFECIKTRMKAAPINSGAGIGSTFHWYILADQIATKLDTNSYMTVMEGLKFKLGHKRPHWKSFSYEYPKQLSYKERVIQILEETLKRLKNDSSQPDILSF